jgi:hypothetical protein
MQERDLHHVHPHKSWANGFGSIGFGGNAQIAFTLTRFLLEPRSQSFLAKLPFSKPTCSQ